MYVYVYNLIYLFSNIFSKFLSVFFCGFSFFLQKYINRLSFYPSNNIITCHFLINNYKVWNFLSCVSTIITSFNDLKLLDGGFDLLDAVWMLPFEVWFVCKLLLSECLVISILGKSLSSCISYLWPFQYFLKLLKIVGCKVLDEDALLNVCNFIKSAFGDRNSLCKSFGRTVWWLCSVVLKNESDVVRCSFAVNKDSSRNEVVDDEVPKKKSDNCLFSKGCCCCCKDNYV